MANKKQKRGLKLHHHAKHAFIPHEGNDYRPHAVRRAGIVVVLAVAAVLHFGYNLATTGDVLGQKTSIEPAQLLVKTNQVRAKAHQAPLVRSDALTKAAFLKAQDMIKHDYWAHQAPDGTQPWKWLSDADYNYALAGENLARNFTTSGGVMTAWLQSPEHRANILKKDYREVGFAVVDGDLNGEQTTLIVAFYGTSADDASVAGVSSGFNQATSGLAAGPVSYLGVAMQSMSPATLGAVILIGLASVSALLAHAYRDRLPKRLRTSWYRHHGAYKAVGLLSVGAVVIFISGGGQI